MQKLRQQVNEQHLEVEDLDPHVFLIHVVLAHYLAEDFSCLSVFCPGLCEIIVENHFWICCYLICSCQKYCAENFMRCIIFFSNFQTLNRKVTPDVISFQAEKFPVSNHLKIMQHD